MSSIPCCATTQNGRLTGFIKKNNIDLEVGIENIEPQCPERGAAAFLRSFSGSEPPS